MHHSSSAAALPVQLPQPRPAPESQTTRPLIGTRAVREPLTDVADVRQAVERRTRAISHSDRPRERANTRGGRGGGPAWSRITNAFLARVFVTLRRCHSTSGTSAFASQGSVRGRCNGSTWRQIGTLPRRVLVDLEDRRVLFYSHGREDPEYCRRSADEIRQLMKRELSRVEQGDDMDRALRAIRNAAREFIDQAGPHSQRFLDDMEALLEGAGRYAHRDVALIRVWPPLMRF